jgi:hypothetical protein
MTGVQAHQTEVALARASEAVLSACREDETDLPDSTRAPDVPSTGRFCLSENQESAYHVRSERSVM